MPGTGLKFLTLGVLEINTPDKAVETDRQADLQDESKYLQVLDYLNSLLHS